MVAVDPRGHPSPASAARLFDAFRKRTQLVNKLSALHRCADLSVHCMISRTAPR